VKRSPTFGDYVRAFVRALQMTLRGETIPAPVQRYPELAAWVETGASLINQVYAVAAAGGLDETARKELRLHLESRDISMETILGAVRHNLTREYPILMQADIDHHLTALYAFNINDAFRVQQLAEALENSPVVQAAVQNLAAHLAGIPPSNRPK
jgi:uncharacterized protein (DUF2236 family)